MKLTKIFFCKNVYHDVVAHVPNFQLSARSSSFFSAVFPSLSWTLFFGGPVIWAMTRDAGVNAASAPDSRQCEALRIRARVTAKTGASPPHCPYPDAQRAVPG